jgi:hypothetical protein
MHHFSVDILQHLIQSHLFFILLLSILPGAVLFILRILIVVLKFFCNFHLLPLILLNAFEELLLKALLLMTILN